MVTVKFRRLYRDDSRPLPSYKTAGAAGMDIPCVSAFTLPPGGRLKVPTGFAIEIPPGYEGQVRARSGLADAHGIGMTNGIGTIDSDFRGELCVLMSNTGSSAVSFKAGERIAQLVIAAVTRAEVEEDSVLTETVRGEGGFGSTGIT